MKSAAARNPEVSQRISRHALRALEVCAFTFATALAAQVRIPVPGSLVPITLQTAIVLLAGLRLGGRDGALSQALYVAFGTLGVPLFAGAAGLAVLMGPTGGYLVGFVFAAWSAGALQKRFNSENSFFRTWLITLLASAAVFVPGLIQLHAFSLSTWSETLAMGLLPFLLGDVLKVTLTTSAYQLSKRN